MLFLFMMRLVLRRTEKGNLREESVALLLFSFISSPQDSLPQQLLFCATENDHDSSEIPDSEGYL